MRIKESGSMKIYEIHNHDLDIHIRYRVLSSDEVNVLIESSIDYDDDAFTKIVLEAVVTNLKSEVAPALRAIPKDKAKYIIKCLYTGSLMLNPSLDPDTWAQITKAPQAATASANESKMKRKARSKRISRVKFLNLERHLKSLVIGQDEAISQLVSALKRSQAGLADEDRPIVIFLFCGASGVGKSYLSKELHNYLYGADYDLIRIDCGEYQHKHENQKLIGSPNGYIGSEEGGILTNALMKNPHTVVLLDEVEKAHPDLWNTFLRVFDEGVLTDNHGNQASFKDAIVIMTTNLGNQEISTSINANHVGFGAKDISRFLNRKHIEEASSKAIKKYFRPELLNRIDRTVVFNNLTNEDYMKIAELELNNVQSKLEKRGFTLTFDADVLQAMVRDGVSHVQGARGLSQLRRDRIENSLADLILMGRYPIGTAFRVSHEASDYRVTAQRPVSKSARSKSRAPIQSNVSPAS